MNNYIMDPSFMRYHDSNRCYNPQEMVQKIMVKIDRAKKQLDIGEKESIKSIKLNVEISPVLVHDRQDDIDKRVNDMVGVRFCNISDFEYIDENVTETVKQNMKTVNKKIDDEFKGKLHEVINTGGSISEFMDAIKKIYEQGRNIPDMENDVAGSIYIGSYSRLKSLLEYFGFLGLPEDYADFIKSGKTTIVYYPDRDIRYKRKMTPEQMLPEEKLLRSFFENNESTPQEPENNGRKI